MVSWQDDLQPFIDKEINKALERCLKGGVCAESEKASIQKHLKNLSMVDGPSVKEPRLEYLGSRVTPKEHLQDLLNQLRDDIYPLFKVPVVTPGGAPFTVLRNVFSYLDYVALLRFGPKGSYGSGMANIENLLDDFGPDDMKERYREYRNYLIQIYRHDLVHLTSPRLKVVRIVNGKKQRIGVIGWQVVSDTFNDKKQKKKNQILEDFDQGASLMKVESFRSNTFFHLRFRQGTPVINSISMFFDLVNYIKQYQSLLENNMDLNAEFSRNFIGVTIHSSVKLLGNQSLDMLKNSHIVFNTRKFIKGL